MAGRRSGDILTRIAPPTGERVEATRRRPVTEARKKRIHAFHGGLCGECGNELHISGPGVVYDHRIPVWTGGADDDGPNMRPLHSACDALKTPVDQGSIAKTKRIIARLDGTRLARKPIPSRAFRKQKARWPKRKFPS